MDKAMALTVSKAGRDRSCRDSDHFSTQCPSAMKQARVFPKPEPVLRIKCDMHPWMSPCLATFAHPVFAVSNPESSVGINNLPAGAFQLKPCRERNGVQTQSVLVSAGEMKQIAVTYKG